MWYKRWWAFADIWRDYNLEENRPTENAAILSIYNQSLYAGYLRWLYGND